MPSSHSHPVNPFKPTAGRTPPILIGRDAVRRDFIDGLHYGVGSPGRLMRIIGSRGTGKTVMLTDLGNIARSEGWVVLDETASSGLCDRLIASLSPPKALKEFTLQPEAFGIRLGEATFSHTRMPLTLRAALSKRIDGLKGDAGVLITLDEVQAADRDDLVAIATAFQHLVREEKNVALVFAALPEAMSEILNDKVLTFLRRAMAENLEPIPNDDVIWAVRQSMDESGMTIAPQFAARAAQATYGYPYMVQLVGYHIWQAAFRRMGTLGPIEEPDVDQGIHAAVQELGVDVIEPVLRGLSPMSIAFLLAMADDGAPSAIKDIAARLGKDAGYVNTYRTRLIESEVIESAGWGLVDFRIPYLRTYIREHREGLSMRVPER